MLTMLNRFRFSNQAFKKTRIYKSHSNLRLLNALVVNLAMSSTFLVENSMYMYQVSCRIFPKTFVNGIINATFGRVFLNGQSFEETKPDIQHYLDNKIRIIMGPGVQGFIDTECTESDLDKNALVFKHSVEQMVKIKDSIIQIKMTGMVNMQIMRTISTAARMMFEFFKKHHIEGLLTGKKLLQLIRNNYGEVSDQEFQQFLSTVFEYHGELDNFTVDEIEWRYRVHPHFLDNSKNSDKVLNTISKITPEQHQIYSNLVRRLDSILDLHSKNTNNFRIIFDAEQTYVQGAIFSLNEQYKYKYNQHIPYIYIPLQNYLNESRDRIKYYVDIAMRKHLYFCVKFVRGAYIVEERRLAVENSYPSPCAKSFEQTTNNYYHNFKYAFSAALRPGSQVLIASHNKDTVEEAIKVLKQKPNPNISMSFGQIYGLAEHLTYYLAQKGYPVYKCLIFGDININVAYLIRRAQELSQMRYPLKLQRELIYHQVMSRIF